jgi:hypothetical protein
LHRVRGSRNPSRGLKVDQYFLKTDDVDVDVDVDGNELRLFRVCDEFAYGAMNDDVALQLHRDHILKSKKKPPLMVCKLLL